MRVLDRHIIVRYTVNFVLLFALLFAFAMAIDMMVNLHRFVGAAEDVLGEDAGGAAVAWRVVRDVIDFQGPKLFQFYGYMNGLVAVGAMAFTLVQMHRHKELVAVMAAGVSLHRVAMPFIAVAFVVSSIHLLNQELVLPRVAPLLLRDHGEIGDKSFEGFAVDFTRDGSNALLQSPQFVPDDVRPRLVEPTILVRDAAGRTVRRISAAEAVWDEQSSAWLLTEGEAIAEPRAQNASAESGMSTESIARWETDLSPHALMVRRHGEYAQMLSLTQIQDMLRTTGVVDTEALVRFKYARFSSVLLNVLVLGLTLPTFLLREPLPMARQALIGAAIAVPALLGGAIGMMVDLPGVPPAVGVFLPVLILLLLVLARWTYFKS